MQYQDGPTRACALVGPFVRDAPVQGRFMNPFLEKVFAPFDQP